VKSPVCGAPDPANTTTLGLLADVAELATDNAATVAQSASAESQTPNLLILT
jgi:hypothetical protein